MNFALACATAVFWRRASPARNLNVVAFAMALLALATPSNALSQNRPNVSNEALQQRLKKFPAADADGDGILTESEARAARKAARGVKSAGAAVDNATRTTPAHANVAYGPHPRHVLDFWPAAANGPMPVLIFFHGGSFKGGDKAMVQARPTFPECLAAGIAVVSANYRFSSDAPFPAPMHDGARVVQFIRSKAKEWNIDSARIALSGGSAGATLALWVALHDDLADARSSDPVARLSSRVTCVSAHSGTAALSSEYFQQHAGVTKLGAALWQLFDARSQAEFDSTEKRQLQWEASPLSHATKDDPPLFLTYAGLPSEAPFPADAPQRDWIHHVSLGLPLKAKYDSMGRECELRHHGSPSASDAEITFLKRHLLVRNNVARP